MNSLNQESYQVLARKYRPQNFDQLVGQEVLVQTLTNAIKHQKIAHAFILTGIRGVGKTTSARIIAKSLNCVGEDGSSKEARIPCNQCDNCQAISRSNFQDVLEIDAASRTGVDDIRSIIDSINYAPAIGRYKVYIIDEVHMLSNNAFNALLKTLEEPPSHTKFIFATTEIKKIPVTVLSRCQRFDLRRLNDDELTEYLSQILQKEGFKAEDRALSLIASAAQGSVRDALSITDRALSCNNYQELLTTDLVEELIGSSDKSFIIEIFEAILSGNVQKTLEKFNEFYSKSSDIANLIQDILEINHRVTLYKTIPDNNFHDLSSNQIDKIREIAQNASIADLAKTWQMLLKGLNEISLAKSNQKIIFEMLIIRICHLNNLPNLGQIIENIQNQNIVKNSANNNQESVIKTIEKNNDFSNEILRNFSNAKIVS